MHEYYSSDPLDAKKIDVPGIRFCDCADRDEALTLFAEPRLAASRWQTVRIRPEFRPW